MYGTGILKGMGITLKRLFSKPTTEFYPYVMPELPKRSRIFLAHNLKEDGSPVCNGCGLCARGCPDQVIRVTQDPEDRKKCKQYTWYAGRCTFCGLCEEACPYGAIGFTQDFEKAAYANKGDGGLIYNVIEDGRVMISTGTVASAKGGGAKAAGEAKPSGVAAGAPAKEASDVAAAEKPKVEAPDQSKTAAVAAESEADGIKEVDGDG